MATHSTSIAEIKTISLKIDTDVLARIDEAATATALNRSAFIRNCTLQVMWGSVPNRDAELEEINVIDTRAREVVVESSFSDWIAWRRHSSAPPQQRTYSPDTIARH